MTSVFKASASNVNDDTLANFVRSDLKDDLESVPGIGPSNKKKLEAIGVYSPKQLIGEYLRLANPSHSIQEHCDAFYQWFKDEADITNGRATIIRALGQKVSTMIPGIYDDEEVQH
eukprot:gb/GECG01008445.1/.p1 GENE.gb/GECG01008445.1/~~gb/GECG01008445.1/.p1  ORF type:complete len:116 (+),score=15.42 gb/GECG01008445.1/:1-348(+)